MKALRRDLQIMRELGAIELAGIIAKGRAAAENIIMTMLDEFEATHPGVYRVIYGEPSDAIASINQDMANLYLDLSCDVVWVFHDAFGKPPEMEDEEEWVSRHLSLIDAELKSLTTEIPMNDKFRHSLQRRFTRRSLEASVQFELLEQLDSEVSRYASFKKQRTKAVQITNNLLFVLVRLMGDLYNTAVPKTV